MSRGFRCPQIRKSCFVCALGVLTLAALARNTTAQNAAAIVEGVVVDSAGEPIAGARVLLQAGSYRAETKTGADGAFTIAGIPGTAGTIGVQAKGFQTATQSWRATNHAARLRIELGPAALEQQVTVTATRAPAASRDVRLTLTQLSAADLARAPALTLDEALVQIPGFSLFRRTSSRTANPTVQGVSLGGLSANGSSRAVVLEDGVPLNDPFGAWVHWDLIPYAEVASVEVMQGGASSLYGNDALGGVIQFLTRQAEEQTAPLHLALETSYGNEDTPDVSFWTAGKKGRWDAALGGEIFRTGGYILVPQSERGPVDTPAGSQHAAGDLRISRSFRSSSGIEGELFARGWYLGELRANGTPLQTNRTHLGQFAIGGNFRLGTAGSLRVRAYGSAETFHQNFSAIAVNRSSEALTDAQMVPAQSSGGSVVWSRAFGARHALVAGFDWLEASGHSHDLFFSNGKPSRFTSAGGRQRNFGLFAEDLIQFAPRWFLAASVRGDYWRNFDAVSFTQPITPGAPPSSTPFLDRTYGVFNPRLTVTRKLGSSASVSASVYRAFRAPTLNELYRPFRQGNVLTEANSGLVPERLTGAEAGLSSTFWNDRLQLRGSFFLNEVTDPVANVTLLSSASLITRQRENLGRTQAPGAELEASTRIGHGITLAGGFQYVDAVVSSFSAEPSLVGRWVPQVPHYALTFRGFWQAPSRFEFSLDGRMSGLQYDDDLNQHPLGRFFVLDAKVSRAIGRGFSLFAAAQNLFDKKYAIAATPVEQLGLPLTARAGFRVEFGH